MWNKFKSERGRRREIQGFLLQKCHLKNPEYSSSKYARIRIPWMSALAAGSAAAEEYIGINFPSLLPVGRPSGRGPSFRPTHFIHCQRRYGPTLGKGEGKYCDWKWKGRFWASIFLHGKDPPLMCIAASLWRPRIPSCDLPEDYSKAVRTSSVQENANGLVIDMVLQSYAISGW